MHEFAFYKTEAQKIPDKFFVKFILPTKTNPATREFPQVAGLI
jgi:hypothetical protein